MSEAEVNHYWLSGYLLNNPKNKGIFPVTHVTQIFINAESNKSIEKKFVSPFVSQNCDPDFVPVVFSAYLKSVQNETVNNLKENNEKAKECTVLYDFEKQNENELSCVKGERLQIVDDSFGDGWVRVKNEKGACGLVPESFLKIDTVQKIPKYDEVNEYEKGQSQKNMINQYRTSHFLIDSATKNKSSETGLLDENSNEINDQELSYPKVQKRENIRPKIPPKSIKTDSLMSYIKFINLLKFISLTFMSLYESSGNQNLGSFNDFEKKIERMKSLRKEAMKEQNLSNIYDYDKKSTKFLYFFK